jgi:hypothetical protein
VTKIGLTLAVILRHILSSDQHDFPDALGVCLGSNLCIAIPGCFYGILMYGRPLSGQLQMICSSPLGDSFGRKVQVKYLHDALHIGIIVKRAGR